jgi:hypothetical protein
MDALLQTEMGRVAAWIQVIALTLGIAGSTAVGTVKILGLETIEAHNADMQLLRDELRMLQRQNAIIAQSLQCLLWEVPADRCSLPPELR